MLIASVVKNASEEARDEGVIQTANVTSYACPTKY
jgi:hypothetical protein